MLIWMCALHCEAKPVIDFYRLKKSTAKQSFDLYSNSDMICIVSGPGANKMTEATHWAAKHCSNQTNLNWINLGIAGHKDLNLGSTILITKATQANNQGSITTSPPRQQLFEVAEIISQPAENTDYHDHALFDMETYDFLKTVTLYSAVEDCQCLKVISDNNQHPPDRNKARISALIADNMKTINQFVSDLQTETSENDVDVL